MIEVLKQMVEALEVDAYVYNGEKSWAAIKAGKQAIAELESQERNFCPRCGKRTADLTTIHTCTPPVAAGSQAFYGFPHGPVSTPNAGGKCVTAGETAPKEST